MNRSTDLDQIAPDDPVIVSSPKKEKVEPIKENKIINTPVDKNSFTNFDQKIYEIFGHTKSPLSSSLVRPKILKFSEQDDGEQIYLALRPHWVNNLSWVFTTFIMLFVPFFLKYFSFLDFFPSQYYFSAVLFWYLFTFIFAFEKFLGWYFDLFLITDQRVVDIDFNNLLNKHFAEADIFVIQDVSFSIKGLLGTFFNFGTVLIQTASEKNQIIFDNVANPQKIMRLLKELRDLEEHHGENL